MSRNKELTRHQVSSRLAYEQKRPAFLQKLHNKIAGVPDEEDEFDDEFEHINDGSGRPPIPRRPAIPERPADDPGSADEDDGDEKPQVVVLKEGKHLTEREAENIRRKEKGLPPLPEPENHSDETLAESSKKDAPKSKEPPPSLSFSSSKSSSSKSSKFKRKVLGDAEDRLATKDSKNPPKKKAKKTSKTLLSFGDDA